MTNLANPSDSFQTVGAQLNRPLSYCRVFHRLLADCRRVPDNGAEVQHILFAKRVLAHAHRFGVTWRGAE